jgi:hypothetical protein
MTDKEKVLVFLRDHEGKASKTQIIIDIFKSGRSQSELADLLASELAGLVVQKKQYNLKNKPQTWKLTTAGWATANQIVAEMPAETQEEAIPEGFARFKSLAKENPDASAQRLLQLAGRHIGDPLQWGSEWQQTRPEWYLQQPRDWYSRDVELDADGYPMRCAENSLIAKEREVRPSSEAGWFERAMRQPGASLEPLAVEMPAFEVANIIRVTRKVGMANAVDIFGSEKITTAHRLVGLSSG